MQHIPLHVNGPARIEIDFRETIVGPVPPTFGTFGFVLGYTITGVEALIRIGVDEWHTDQSGDHVPGAILTIGKFAELNMELIKWHADILDKLMAKPFGNGVFVGNSNTAYIGIMQFSSEAIELDPPTAGVNRTVKLYVISEEKTGLPQEPVHLFNNVYNFDSQGFILGHRVTRMLIKGKGLGQDQVDGGNVYRKLSTTLTP